MNDKNPYKLPEDYFESMQREVFLKTQSEERPFAVPEGYFESMQDRVLKKAQARPKILTLVSKYWAVAACMIILLVATIWINPAPSSDTYVLTEEDIFDLYVEDLNFETIVSYTEAADLYTLDDEYTDESIEYIFDTEDEYTLYEE